MTNLGSSSALGSATGLVTNRLPYNTIGKNSIVTGLRGSYTFSGKLVIDGQQMTSPMPWIIRWDYDSTDPKKMA